jgi:hypothetical protein
MRLTLEEAKVRQTLQHSDTCKSHQVQSASWARAQAQPENVPPGACFFLTVIASESTFKYSSCKA